MAGLTKTYTRDLSTAIAGKLWQAIKDADERRELEKSKASEEVKKAAVKIKREDTNSIPVQDKDLRETVVKIFGPIEGRLLQTEGKVSNISGKITTVAGGVADTQKLIINQNQILEDKFDQILNVIGTKNHLAAKLKAENDFKQLELNLEKGLDLSGTFAYEKAGGRSGFGVMGALLSGILGNRMTARLVRQLYKKIVPKGLRARARLLGKTVRPFGRAVGFASRPLKNLVKLSLTSVLKVFAGSLTSPRRLSRIARLFGKGALGDSVRGRKWFKKGFSMAASRRSFGNVARTSWIPNMIARAKIFGSLRTFNVDRVAEQIISEYANAATVLRNKSTIAKTKKFYSKGIGKVNLNAGRKVMKRLAKHGSKEAAESLSKKSLQKGGSKVAVNLTEDILSSKGLIEAFNNPIVQKRIATKLGPQALQDIGIKLGAGGLKSVGIGPGTLYALGEGLMRLSPAFGGSDSLGMALSFGSAIPWAGWGVAILDILRDIDREAFDTHILPNVFALNDEHIANFFKQALDIDQLERGNVNFKPSGGMGGTIDSISEILGVTKAFGDATGFGPEVKGLVGQAGLDTYPTGKSDYKFDVSGSLGGGGNIDNAKNKEAELRKKEEHKDDKGDNEPVIDDDRTSGEKIGDIIGETVDEVDRSLDTVRSITGGKRDDGKFSIFGLEIRNPLNTKPKGGGGIGGDSVTSTTPTMGGSGSVIEFWGQQGRDLSGEPGVDFSFKDYKNNYNLFPGYVLETGLLYGSRYGNVVVVRSTDPSNGKQFDSLYSHFPDGGIYVKPGQEIGAGPLLGSVGFVSVDTPGKPQMQPNNAGNMSGWHTSVDFFEPGSAARYHNADKIINLVIGADGQTPNGLLEKLKPPVTSDDQSSLNNIESNSNLASTMTSMVEKGSSERLMTKRKSSKRLPIVIINNQVINTSQTQVAMGNSKESSNFFEAYNLARYTV